MLKLNESIESKIEKAERYEASFDKGLDDGQVLSRNEAGLTNRIAKHVTKSYLRIILDNVFNFFNVLLISVAVLMAVAQVPIKRFAFVVIFGANMIIGLVQDLRARHMIDKLKVVSYPMVKVIRNGQEIEIPANKIVLDDVVVLANGNQIVCDGVVLDGSVEANESMLTGESVNIVKKVGSQIYSGSYVTSGLCRYRVTAVGRANYAEKLQTKTRQFKKAKSEILRTIKLFFKVIGFVVVTLGSALFITYYKFNLLQTNFTTGVDSISGSLVSMLPTGMYLLTSLTLALGVIRLANKRMLVQELYSIEMLARVDVVCFDKTGTLTDGTMRVKELKPLGDLEVRKLRELVKTLVVATQDSNATAEAIKKAFDSEKSLDFHSANPFNSLRKFSSVALKDGTSIILGAREFIPHGSDKITKLAESYEKEGLRVLLIAKAPGIVDINEPLKKVEPIGLLVLEDHIRDDVYENIKWFKDNDVTVKIISGDNPISVSEIARRVGVQDAEKFISLDGMSIEEVKKIANDYVVFGRVSPEQKEALVSAMQAEGHTVAMTGDGVNDILALKVADCSIAMASGSDAAKNIAHLVTLDNNFSTLPDVVAEGRRVINNLQRACSLFLVKTLFAMVTTLIFLIIVWSTNDIETYKYPFVTANMYVWELITLGFGSLMLSIQPNNEKLGKYGFMTNIITRTLPAAFVQITIVGAYLLMFAGGVIDYQTALALAVITFSVTAFIVFVRVCIPFDIYRTVLVSGLALICVIVFIIDHHLFTQGNGFFEINYTLVNKDNWWLLVMVIAGAIPLYILMEFIANKINKFVHKIKERGA